MTLCGKTPTPTDGTPLKAETRSRKRYARYVAVAVTAAAWLTWRWVTLGTEVASLQRRLAENLRGSSVGTTDPGSRVALIVQADEPLLDRTIALASARQTLFWVTGLVWLLALGLA